MRVGAERIDRTHRLRTSSDYAPPKAEGTAFRGRHCLVLAVLVAGAPTRIGFIASKKGVGGAVQRNRARRRIRETVRRLWPEMRQEGIELAFIAYRSSVTAPYPELAADIRDLLARTGALAPPEDRA